MSDSYRNVRRSTGTAGGCTAKEKQHRKDAAACVGNGTDNVRCPAAAEVVRLYLLKGVSNTGQSASTGMPKIYNKMSVVHFNKSDCSWNVCRYRHLCSVCSSSGHGKWECPSNTRISQFDFVCVEVLRQGVVQREVMPINNLLDTMAPSPVNVAESERELVAAAVELLDDFINGFKINYIGPRRPTNSGISIR